MSYPHSTFFWAWENISQGHCVPTPGGTNSHEIYCSSQTGDMGSLGNYAQNSWQESWLSQSWLGLDHCRPCICSWTSHFVREIGCLDWVEVEGHGNHSCRKIVSWISGRYWGWFLKGRILRKATVYCFRCFRWELSPLPHDSYFENSTSDIFQGPYFSSFLSLLRLFHLISATITLLTQLLPCQIW